ncbi:hypothetical protein UGMREWDR_CDS0176 [Aeromonas phage GomatiRiver_11]|nr:hypothetical protein OBDJBBDK_00167 [Aeromonas phage AhFM11]WKW84343.1 hypothetical protein UGMREWDR_CDS0176 [Aeromonas phage GomatiRiver_11]
MEYIINKHGIAFVVTVAIDKTKLDGCKSYHSLYDMNCDMFEDSIGYEYLITREAKDEPVMMFTQFSGEQIKIEVERFISEYIL